METTSTIGAFTDSITSSFSGISEQIFIVAGVAAVLGLTIWAARRGLRTIKGF